MRDYGKVHSSFWTSSTARGMSEDARMLALYLLTSPHSNIVGVFRLPDGYASEDLQWDRERVSKGFAELFEKGFASRCESTKWVWVIKHLDWNPPENPNQRKSAKKIALTVPAECAWRADFIRVCGERIGIECDVPSNRSETLAEPFRNQEQEQEQEQEKTYPNPDGLGVASAADDPIPAAIEADLSHRRQKPSHPPCPHQQIIAAYHELLPASPRIRDWTPARADHLRCRWNEDPKRQNLDWWRRFFGYIAESAFLTGRATSGDRRPFTPGLDWICKAENFAKIREGRFHDEEAA